EESGAAGRPDAVAMTPTSQKSKPDVEVSFSGRLLPNGSLQWRTNPLSGNVVYEKPASARRILADRISQMNVDVLALQEVEDIRTLEEFARSEALRAMKYRHIVLVEGNDPRLIDVGLLSRFPVGSVTSWRHRPYQNKPGKPVFSRDLLEVEILSEDRSHVLFTVFVNHLKSQLARDAGERT